MRKALAALLNKPASELTTEELEMLAAEKRKQTERELEQKRQKLQAKVDRLSARLGEAQGELAALPKPEGPSKRGRKATKARKLKKTEHRPIVKLDAASNMVDMITVALFEAGEPMTASEIYEKIQAKMKKAGKGGKNPKQAIGSALGTSDRFEKTKRGVYQLADQAKEQVAALKGK